MKKTICVFLLLTAWIAAQPSQIFTDDRQLPRTYDSAAPRKTVEPAIFAQVPWESVEPGTRRKVLFNDRLTMVLFQIDHPIDDTPVKTHYHAHDQISYLLEGRGRVRVGNDEREIEAGGAYVAPSNVHHGLKPLTPHVLLMECFTPAREDFRKSR